MLKRIVSLIIAITLATTMGACGEGTIKPTNPSVPATDPVANTTVPGDDAITDPTDNADDIPPSEPVDDEPGVELAPDLLPSEPPTDSELPTNPTEPSADPVDPAPVIPVEPSVPIDPIPPEDDVIEVPVTPTEPVVPHVHNYKTKTTPATCTEPGKKTVSCECGDGHVEEIAKLGHEYGDSYYIAPTPESEGREGEICKRCGYDKYQVLEKLPPLATNEDTNEIEALIIQYINEYRAAEGACATKRMEGCDVFTQYRSNQMAEKGKANHDTTDIRAAATAVKYGVYTDPSIYGLPGEPYYAVKGREAVGMDGGGSIEYVAKTLATGFHNSTTHWSYLGDNANSYISVGVTEKDGKWYCCIVVAPVNLDENPNGI